MNSKISKLEAQFVEEKNSLLEKKTRISNIFHGISIFVNGYTEPSADELRCMMLLHGGTYHHYYRKEKTTHIIATSLPNAKHNQMKNLKIVLPKWITESIKERKLLNYNNYLLQNELHQGIQHQQNNFSTKCIMENGKELKESKTAADNGYLKEFYSNSRLHYISTLASTLKQYISDLREKHTGFFLGRKLLQENSGFKMASNSNFFDKNIIMHVDMDCFFVSVALRKYPHLKGQPVAVAHAKNKAQIQNESKNFEFNFYKNKMKSKIMSKARKKTNNSANYIHSLENNKTNTDSESDFNLEDDFIEKWSNEFSSMSEIASCSYEARKYGVCKGMYLGAAIKLCPSLKTISYDFEGYKEVSMMLYNIMADYTLDIEAVSCDELYLDCTSLLSEIKITPWKLAEVLRSEIEKKTYCTASIGIGENKLQARLATSHAKPNGQYQLTPDELDNFMKNLNVSDIPGIGRTIGAQLKNLKIKTCHDLQNISLDTLKKKFGLKTGETLYNCCRGIDKKPVNYNNERKSISADVNYGIRFNDDEETEMFLKQLSEEVSKRLKDVKMMGRSITLKVMFRAKNAPLETAKYLGHGACDTISRSVGLTSTTSDAVMISKNVLKLYRLLRIPASDLRGMGVQITKLEPERKNHKTLHTYFDQSDQKKNLFKRSSNLNEKIMDIKPSLEIPALISTCKDENLNLLFESSEIKKIFNSECMKCIPEQSIFSIEKKIKDENAKSNVQILSLENFEGTGEEIDRLLKLNFKELKLMIKEWVAAEKDPEPFDVTALKTYFKYLVENKNLEKLCILLRCLHRYIKTERKYHVLWQMTYDDIVDTIQNSMVTVFGRTLSNEFI